MVNINQPINPCIIAKYLGIPFIGISPKPRVVNVFIDRVNAFRNLIEMSKIIKAKIQTPIIKLVTTFLLLGKSTQRPFKISPSYSIIVRREVINWFC